MGEVVVVVVAPGLMGVVVVVVGLAGFLVGGMVKFMGRRGVGSFRDAVQLMEKRGGGGEIEV